MPIYNSTNYYPEITPGIETAEGFIGYVQDDPRLNYTKYRLLFNRFEWFYTKELS